MQQTNQMDQLLARLKESHPLSGERIQRPDLAFCEVDKGDLFSFISHLRDREGFTHLVLLTAVDWIEAGEFQLTYLVNQPAGNRILGVEVRIPRDNPVMESIHPLWATAATYQRELKEMFGIDFPGSPRLDQSFILEGWEGTPPYRRDFDTLKYSEETYFPRPGRGSRDPESHMREKLYPREGGSHD